MLLKSKRITMAATLALYANKIMPTMAQVQTLKLAPEHSTGRAMIKLHPSLSDATKTSTVLWEKLESEAHEFLKLLRRKDDRWLAQHHPHMHNLWLGSNPVALPAAQGHDNVTKLPVDKSNKELLVEYNRLLKLKALKPFKVWKEGRKKLELRIAKLRKSIEHDIPAWRTFPAAVAEGAYQSDVEAVYRTGHGQSGPSRSAAKTQARKERFIERRLAENVAGHHEPANVKKAPHGVLGAPERASSVRVTSTKLPAGEHVSLADIARSIDMDPRVARAIARRNARAVAKLEVKGSKYKFTQTHTVAVVKLLKGE